MGRKSSALPPNLTDSVRPLIRRCTGRLPPAFTGGSGNGRTGLPHRLAPAAGSLWLRSRDSFPHCRPYYTSFPIEMQAVSQIFRFPRDFFGFFALPAFFVKALDFFRRKYYSGNGTNSAGAPRPALILEVFFVTTVTREDITRAVRALGIAPGDTVIVHSSFKSMGTVEGGAQAVIDGIMDAVGSEGTLVFPTLCKDNWAHIYEDWNPATSPSYVGYLTNFFRECEGVLRSDQATHSVAAKGKHAAYLTETHGTRGKRWGIYGDTPFAADSPWEKMFALHAKVVLLGVEYSKCTFRHFVEYRFVNRYLHSIEDVPDYRVLLDRVWCYDRFEEGGVWPAIDNMKFGKRLEMLGLVTTSRCGDAELKCFSSFDYVNTADRLLETEPEVWMNEATLAWLRDVRAAGHNGLRDFVYEADLRRRFLAALPDKIYDAHLHANMRRKGAVRPDSDRWYNSMTDIVGSRLFGGLMMDTPTATVAEDFEGYTEKIVETAAGYGCEVGMVTPPTVGYERAAAMLDKYPIIKLLKPYFCFAPDRLNADLLTFAPEWLFRLANDRRMPVLLHLAHYDLQLAHPKNIAQICEMCEKYPNMTLILAHCAMGHNYDRLHTALPQIAHLKNITFDCSGISEPLSIYYCLKTFGAERMMYGGDYNFGDSLGRINGQGGNFFAIHPQITKILNLPGDYRYVALSNAYEGMLALLTAGELYGLTPAQWQDIFYHNAVKLFC